MMHHTAEGTTSLRRQARRALMAAMFLCLMGAPGVANADFKEIDVDISPGDTKETNVGCGFELITEPTMLEVELYWPIPTPVDDSGCVEQAPLPQEYAWKKVDNYIWWCFGIEPNMEFWVVLWGVKGGAGLGEPDKRWMSVSDCDLDADTDNDSTLPHRPPEADDEEDLAEWPSALQDEVIGLLIPINDDNDLLVWNQRDGMLGMGDYDKDDDLLDLLLTINAMKAGELQLATGAYAYLYDEAGHWYFDAEFDKRVPRGKDFPKPLRIEGCANTTSGTVGELSLYFLPDEERVLWAEDKVKCLYVGVDLDVDSDNNGEIETPNYLVTGEDFYENHPASELASHPEFKNGMIVGVNDDDDDGNSEPDNGWNGTAWTGPDALTVQNGENESDFGVGKLRRLHLTPPQAQYLQDDLNAKVRLVKVAGPGAVRVFTYGGSPAECELVLTAVNDGDKSETFGSSSTLWSKVAAEDLDLGLLVEGLKPGEVQLQAEFRIRTTDDDPDSGILIHKDTVRITVCGLDLDVNHDGDVDDDVDGIYGYWPGYRGATSWITYNTGGASVVYTAGQQMNLIAATGPNITSVEFRIISSSHEPGFCMNSSDSPNTDDDDYSFSATGKDREPKTVTVSDNKAVQAFYCKDFGGYCTVQAVFKMGDVEVFTIQRSIPRDGNANCVADAWPGNKGPGASEAAIDDNDDTPAGDNTPGDMLSRYQEYRGFIVNGTHVRTLPTQKDVFIRDVDNLGAGDFTTAILGAPVHYIMDNEWNPANRRINERQGTAHVNVETAIRVVNGGAGPVGMWGAAVTNPFEPNVPNNLVYCRLYMTTVQGVAANLTANVNPGDTVVPVTFIAGYGPPGWFTPGRIRIGAEVIPYTGVTANSFTGCTVTANHNNGDAVGHFSFDVPEFVRRVFAHEAAHVVGMEDIGAGTNSIMTTPANQGGVFGTNYWHVFGGAMSDFRVHD